MFVLARTITCPFEVMVFATVKKTGSMMKPSFGVFMHNPPVHIEDCDSLELENPAFRVEATLGGHFVILQVSPFS